MFGVKREKNPETISWQIRRVCLCVTKSGLQSKLYLSSQAAHVLNKLDIPKKKAVFKNTNSALKYLEMK